jgi:hypothetical protein
MENPRRRSVTLNLGSFGGQSGTVVKKEPLSGDEITPIVHSILGKYPHHKVLSSGYDTNGNIKVITVSNTIVDMRILISEKLPILSILQEDKKTIFFFSSRKVEIQVCDSMSKPIGNVFEYYDLIFKVLCALIILYLCLSLLYLNKPERYGFLDWIGTTKILRWVFKKV